MSSFTCDSKSARLVPNAACTKLIYPSSPTYFPLGNRYCANGPVCSSRRRSSSDTCRCSLSAACFRIARCTSSCADRVIMYDNRKSGSRCCCNCRCASCVTCVVLIDAVSPNSRPASPGARTVAYTDASEVVGLSINPGTR